MKLAIGSAQFGMNYGVNNKRGKIPKEEVFKILEKAIDSGIEIIDTAKGYGSSQKVIGNFIKNNPGIDKKIKIVSKEKCNDINIVKNVYHSLDLLNVNKLYGLLVHDFKQYVINPKIWDVVVKLKKEGKIEKIGFSLYHPEELEKIMDDKLRIDIVQIPYSIFDQRFSKMLPLLKKKNIEVHVRSVFLQGLIFKKPDEMDEKFIKIKNKLLELISLSKKDGISLSTVCINFAVLNKNIDKVIIGVDSLENLQENIRSLKYKVKVRARYNQLLNLKEDDEDIILTASS
ncbi:unnamed protein product [marine sediment metagenome]|uniref:NADP-dependent oxidoreductase domain-containing protein n=1 Tax=marine sediment metagenome TaxID=412755 RepID=X1DF89_9ZZZZ